MKSSINILGTALISASLLLVSCAEETVKPSAELLEKFKTDYPLAIEAEWEMEGNEYEVEFTDGDVQRSVIYTSQGVIVATEHTITTEDLPEVAASFIQGKYGDVVISEVEFVQRGESRYFEVEFLQGEEKVELYFNREGIKVTPDFTVELGEEEKD